MEFCDKEHKSHEISMYVLKGTKQCCDITMHGCTHCFGHQPEQWVQSSFVAPQRCLVSYLEIDSEIWWDLVPCEADLFWNIGNDWKLPWVNNCQVWHHCRLVFKTNLAISLNRCTTKVQRVRTNTFKLIAIMPHATSHFWHVFLQSIQRLCKFE